MSEQMQVDETWNQLTASIKAGDSAQVRQWLADREFLMLNIEDDESDDEQMVATLTIPTDKFMALVAFTDQDHATEFVDGEPELFGDTDELEGYIVDGETLLEYLPGSYGLILNANCSMSATLAPELLAPLEDHNE